MSTNNYDWMRNRDKSGDDIISSREREGEGKRTFMEYGSG